MSESKAREFWLIEHHCDPGELRFIVGKDLWNESIGGLHVIEYSAYDAKCRELEETKDDVEALEAERDALKAEIKRLEGKLAEIRKSLLALKELEQDAKGQEG